MYKYKPVVDRIREVLLPYESLETMCDLATCLLTQLVPNIEIIAGEVTTDKKTNHIWAYDTKEKYYIDITSEQFGYPLLCTQDVTEFEKRGYVISSNFHTWNGAFQQWDHLKKGPVLVHCGKEVTMDQLLTEIQRKRKTKKWTLFGTRKKR